MKFALVNDTRQEASPSLVGECVGCGSPVIARCGEVRIHHWAHKGRVRCDPWWEPETEWHRAWKNQFPSAWQEVVHHAETGEKHVADVSTDGGWILEFQHSRISREERDSREKFYRRLIWVVDGARTPAGKRRFLLKLEDGGVHKRHPEVRSIASQIELLRSWTTSSAHVVFGFGEDLLWWLLSGSDEQWSYLVAIPKSTFIAFFGRDSADNSMELRAFIEKYELVSGKRESFPSLDDYQFIKPRTPSPESQ